MPMQERKPNYKIRKAKIKEASIINRITYNTIKYVNAKDYTKKQTNARLVKRTNTIKKMIKDKTKNVFVITKNNKIVGWTSLNLKEHLLITLYIRHNLIGKGLGKRLLKYAEKYAKIKKIKYLQFDSTLTAKEFYKSQGYKTIRKTMHKTNGVNIPCIKMKKIL